MRIKLQNIVLACFLVINSLMACPWPMGRDNGYLGLSYSVSDYNSVYANDKQIRLSDHKVTNEAWDLYYLMGVNEKDTLIFTTKYSNIGAYDVVPGPKVSQISDSYLGFKRSYRTGKISAAWELGVMIPGDYAANLFTSPGYGETEINLAWHWAKILDSISSYSFSARYRKRSNEAPNAAQLTFEYSRRLSNVYQGRFILHYDEQFSDINVLDPASGWVDFVFHRKDESQLIAGLGLSRKISRNMNMNFLISRKFDGRNTDAADRNISVGIGTQF